MAGSSLSGGIDRSNVHGRWWLFEVVVVILVQVGYQSCDSGRVVIIVCEGYSISLSLMYFILERPSIVSAET